jgi:hypothetical protein
LYLHAVYRERGYNQPVALLNSLLPLWTRLIFYNL